jgi:hypothetical protein
LWCREQFDETLVTVLMAILLWLFPDGHLPAGRWHGVSTAAVAAGLRPRSAPGCARR